MHLLPASGQPQRPDPICPPPLPHPGAAAAQAGIQGLRRPGLL